MTLKAYHTQSNAIKDKTRTQIEAENELEEFGSLSASFCHESLG